ncbi:hypothetical protein ACIS7S_12075 [Providencia sp. DFU6]|uniref:hypothetical protein n=1 Tax=Providencia TaxID=586 RepID=UPI00202220AA|nr:hypothetical protein [Providencia stuartii]ELR5044680.1 hypothetical protein [Providencia rettgeri]URE77381.1 hypothetical protein MWH14_13080 [Providencia stuartii]
MKKILLAIIILVVAFLGFGAFVSSTPEGKEKSKARDAIKYCWSEYDKKSITDEQKRFIAGACEKMESDFRSNYGVNP